jgi:hypothetical protein
MTVFRMLAALLAGYAFGWPRSNVSRPRPAEPATLNKADAGLPLRSAAERGAADDDA